MYIIFWQLMQVSVLPGFKAEHFMDMLKNFNPENGRMEQFRIKGAGVTTESCEESGWI